LKGCIVKGRFDTGVSKIWLNPEFEQKLHGVFAPLMKMSSYCTVAVPYSTGGAGFPLVKDSRGIGF
jgi:hypothetical protein